MLPGPARAEELLRGELAHSEYRPSLLRRVADWVQDLLGRVGDRPGRFSDLGWPVLLVVVVVLVVALAFVLSRLRRNAGVAVAEQRVFDDVRRSSAEHRALAQAAHAAGEHDTAVVEAIRALTAGLVERRVVDDVPAATAHEVVGQAEGRYPGLGDRLRAAADLFDATRYGGRHASAEQAASLLELEQTVAATPPDGARSPGTPVAAVPR